MPIEDLALGLLQVIGRFVVYFLVEIVIEILVKGPGYFIVKAISSPAKRKEINVDGFSVLLAGIIFWGTVGIGTYFIISKINIE